MKKLIRKIFKTINELEQQLDSEIRLTLEFRSDRLLFTLRQREKNIDSLVRKPQVALDMYGCLSACLPFSDILDIHFDRLVEGLKEDRS